MDQTGDPATPFGDGAYPEKPANKEVQRCSRRGTLLDFDCAGAIPSSTFRDRLPHVRVLKVRGSFIRNTRTIPPTGLGFIDGAAAPFQTDLAVKKLAVKKLTKTYPTLDS